MPGLITLHQDVEGVTSTVSFDCPACEKKRVKGEIAEREDQVRLLYLVPLFKLRATRVVCPECKTSIACDVPLEQALELRRAELTKALRWGVSPAGKVVSLLSLLTCIVPFVGMTLGLVGWYLTRGTRGWPGICAFWGTVIGIAVSLCVGLMMVMPR